MQRTKTITIGDRDVTVKELNIAQIKNVMENMENVEASTIDLLFPDSIPAHVIAESADVSIKKMEESFSPSELKQIIEKVEDLNPFFVNLLTRMVKIGREVLKDKTLTPPVAD